ncbi:MAG: hypothetical protein FWC66_05385 [Oscillospiraceae bacterium]|nr:hypothetical protein [Oscillospiraceae bacterium]
MGIEYYAFALFIAGLICIIAILFKVLFSDLRRQNRLLDEKETKLLKLYLRVEEIMEEFTAQAKTTSYEIKEFESRIAMRTEPLALIPQTVKNEQTTEKLPAFFVTVDSNRIRTAGEVVPRVERMLKADIHAPEKAMQANDEAIFQTFFDDAVGALSPIPEIDGKYNRNELILAMAKEGKADAQIASELGITQNEVRLVQHIGNS